jgi:hypothetical protein
VDAADYAGFVYAEPEFCDYDEARPPYESEEAQQERARAEVAYWVDEWYGFAKDWRRDELIDAGEDALNGIDDWGFVDPDLEGPSLDPVLGAYAQEQLRTAFTFKWREQCAWRVDTYHLSRKSRLALGPSLLLRSRARGRGAGRPGRRRTRHASRAGPDDDSGESEPPPGVAPGGERTVQARAALPRYYWQTAANRRNLNAPNPQQGTGAPLRKRGRPCPQIYLVTRSFRSCCLATWPPTCVPAHASRTGPSPRSCAGSSSGPWRRMCLHRVSVAAMPDRRRHRTSGRALIFLRTGHVYEGHVVVEGGVAHFSGKRRLHAGIYRPAADRAWPLRSVAEVRWLTEALAA